MPNTLAVSVIYMPVTQIQTGELGKMRWGRVCVRQVLHPARYAWALPIRGPLGAPAC